MPYFIKKTGEFPILSIDADPIPLQDFKNWFAFFSQRNYALQANLDLTNDDKVIFFERQTLVDLIDQEKDDDHVVGSFGCTAGNKGLNVFLSVFHGTNSLQEGKGIWRGNSAMGRQDTQILRSELRDFSKNFHDRNFEITENNWSLQFGDEAKGITHKIGSIRAMLAAITTTYIKVYFIYNGKRTTIAFTDEDFDETRVATLPPTGGDAFDNGGECCPIGK